MKFNRVSLIDREPKEDINKLRRLIFAIQNDPEPELTAKLDAVERLTDATDAGLQRLFEMAYETSEFLPNRRTSETVSEAYQPTAEEVAEHADWRDEIATRESSRPM